MTEEEKKINRKIRSRTILSFSVFLAMIVLAILFWKWLNRQPEDNGIAAPLRAVLNMNEKVNNKIFSDKHIEPTYPKEKSVQHVRFNGELGMTDELDTNDWELTAIYHNSSTPDTMMTLKMNDIKSLPKTDITFDFKCIEGWSQITHWGGVKFSDFCARYKLGTHSGKAPDKDHPEDLYKYVGLMTPDSDYYVGIDMKSMLHPQTILCYEMNDSLLPERQGAPLRLIIPVKYGIKHLKRIGTIYFSDSRPPDYWFEQGYDYDAAL